MQFRPPPGSRGPMSQPPQEPGRAVPQACPDQEHPGSEGGRQLNIRPVPPSVTLTKVLEASYSAFRDQVTATQGLGRWWAGPASAWVVRAQKRRGSHSELQKAL